MTTTQETLKQIVTELEGTYYERNDSIQAMILAILTKQHVALIGPPGTAKSEMARDLASRLTGTKYFETILSRVAPAESVLGPLDLPLLRDTGEFTRRSSEYLPGADVAFIDEAFKMSPVLGHSLLAILNERKMHEVRDGVSGSVHSVPLHTAFMASNEIPEEDESGALWDRVVLRVKVEYIKSGTNFANLFGDVDVTRTELPWDELIKSIETEVNEVLIPPKVIDVLWDIREKLQQHGDVSNPEGIVISDRRWKSCAKILKAQAWLAGRDMVSEVDLLALKHVLWVSLDQIDTVERLLIAHADRVADQIRTLRDNIAELSKGIKERKDYSREQRADHSTHIMRKMKAIRQECIRIESEHPGHAELKVLLKQFKACWSDLFKILMDQPEGADWDKWYKSGI